MKKQTGILENWINFFFDWFNLSIEKQTDFVILGFGKPGCFKILVPKEINLAKIIQVFQKKGFSFETEIEDLEKCIDDAKRRETTTYIAYDKRNTVVESCLLYL